MMNMQVEVLNVTKEYGTQKALDAISFTIQKGEILGLLGPNGAGKSTLMKIISCFIPPTQGTVRVNGFDIFDNSLDVRRQIGYLPEHNPLYLDMYVTEYLYFIAQIYKLDSKQAKEQTESMVELTGLTKERGKKIGELSKGYRQRVGIAQALIHNPKVLILDEPTSGLDPNQLDEIRNLIKQLGKEKILIFSTHIMQEVEAVCSRALIINNGRIVADESTAKLAQLGILSNRFIVEFEKEVSLALFAELEGLSSVHQLEGTVYLLEAIQNHDIRKLLFNWAMKYELTLLTIKKEEERIEQIFQKLTR